MENNFYIYAYLDPTKPINKKYGEYFFEYEPFYIGKGKNNRAFVHIATAKWYHKTKKRKMTHLHNKILSIDFKPIIIKIKIDLSEQEAFDLEVILISLIGRYDLKLGPLCNMSNGGDGQSGRIPWNKGLTSETNPIVKKYSEARIGVPHPHPENYKPSEKQIEKAKENIKKLNERIKAENIPNYWKGKTFPQETKDKLKDAWYESKNHLIKTYYFIKEDILYVIKGLKHFMKEFKLSTRIVRVHTKHIEEYNGFTLYEDDIKNWNKQILYFDYYKDKELP